MRRVFTILFVFLILITSSVAQADTNQIVTVTQNVNLREGPSSSDQSLSVLSIGTKLEVLADGGKWLLVNTVYGRGYITSLSAEANPVYGILACNAPLYKAKSGGKSVSLLPAGFGLKLESLENGRYAVKYDTITGFVDASLVNLQSSLPPAGVLFAGITLSAQSLRKSASGKAGVLTKIPQNTIIEVVSMQGSFAGVRYGSYSGYLPISGLRIYFSDKLLQKTPRTSISAAANSAGRIVNTKTQKYGYAQMVTDIQKLKNRFPAFVSVQSLGRSTAGRDIPLILLGNPNAPQHIWIDASIHAREYMGTQIVMNQVELILNNSKNGLYKGNQVKKLLQNVCLHIVPMLNPDGVELSQRGLASVASLQDQAYLLSLNGGSTDFSRWKANILGIDLNGNFDANWAKYNSSTTFPSPTGYKGNAPFCAVEAQLVSNYLTAHKMDLAISYHAAGSELYWWYGQGGDCEERDFLIASEFSDLTNYSLVSKRRSRASNAGLKDWVISKLQTPALTIELGPTLVLPPIPIKYYSAIWDRNKYVLLTAMNCINRSI